MACYPSLHARYLEMLPRIETHARIYFRDVRCPDQRADQIAETIGLAWKWFLRLEERGKDVSSFVSALATFAAKAVRCGRRVAGMESAQGFMNSVTQRRQGFSAERLPDFSSMMGHPLEEALADNTLTPPPDAAAFRIDFPRWMTSLSERERRLAMGLMQGERTRDAASRLGMSPGRVSQVRRELRDDWARFHGEVLEVSA